jgi:hypothetical protein
MKPWTKFKGNGLSKVWTSACLILSLSLSLQSVAYIRKDKCPYILGNLKAFNSEDSDPFFNPPHDDLSFIQLGREAGGSQGGSWFKDEAGVNYFGKSYSGDEERVLAEHMINEIYAEMGMRVPKTWLRRLNGVAYILSREVPGRVAGAVTPLKKTDIREGFVIDAWLANWDVLGDDYDNILMSKSNYTVGPKKQAVRVDNGGALFWKAMGGEKEFSTEVAELWNMRNPDYRSGEVFADLSDAQVAGQIRGFLARYARDHERIKSSIKYSGFSQEASRKILKILDARALWMVNKGLERLGDAGGSSNSMPLARAEEELRSTLGDVIWAANLESATYNKLRWPITASKLTDGELVALETYMGGDFDQINGALRGFDEYWEWVPESLRSKVRLEAFKPEIQLVINALNKLPDFRGRVSRVVELHGNDIWKYRVGKTIVEPAFISTTHKGTEPYPGNVKFEILSKTGKRVSFLNESTGEDEILFKPSTKFKVLKKERRNDNGELLWIIKLEEQ